MTRSFIIQELRVATKNPKGWKPNKPDLQENLQIAS